MIYISSACVKFERIEDSVLHLYNHGFHNIELSGGTKYYEHKDLIHNLIELKNEYKLNYIIHNYFPPPKEAFILNLASLDEDVNSQSFEHLKNCIDYSVLLGSNQLGFHAGFFFDIPLNQMGKKITVEVYENWDLAKQKFIDNYNKLNLYAKQKGVTLYIENNVYSLPNKQTYGEKSPLMLLSYKDFESLSQQINFNLLLDLAHLKVSCNSLEEDFHTNLNELFHRSNYIHLSDNDGKIDSNKVIQEGSTIFNFLKKNSIKNKTVTLEMYEDLDQIKSFYNQLKSM